MIVKRVYLPCSSKLIILIFIDKIKFINTFLIFRGLVGKKNLTADDMDPVLEKLKEHLVAKNVAIEIATKLCSSVSSKLEGKVKLFFLLK